MILTKRKVANNKMHGVFSLAELCINLQIVSRTRT